MLFRSGFGADLGAEKFFDIKCRKAGLKPSVAVIVATVRALKYHGGQKLKELTTENVKALEAGCENLERHIQNVQGHFGIPCVIAINHFTSDTEKEISFLKNKATAWEVPIVTAKHWALGGAGSQELAQTVVDTIDSKPSHFKTLYEDALPLWTKIETVAKKIYGASEVHAEKSVMNQIEKFREDGFGHFPICIAKTQYSFSTNPKLRGAPKNHTIQIREVRLSAGAEFIVVVCGDIMTMPGLPKEPAAYHIDIDTDGNVVGLS